VRFPRFTAGVADGPEPRRAVPGLLLGRRDFLNNLGGAPTSRHVMGTLRMGPEPASSVVDPAGRFHDVDNLYACDGGVFPTSSGYNPTLTIIAVALKIAHGIAGTRPGG